MPSPSEKYKQSSPDDKKLEAQAKVTLNKITVPLFGEDVPLFSGGKKGEFLRAKLLELLTKQYSAENINFLTSMQIASSKKDPKEQNDLLVEILKNHIIESSPQHINLAEDEAKTILDKWNAGNLDKLKLQDFIPAVKSISRLIGQSISTSYTKEQLIVPKRGLIETIKGWFNKNDVRPLAHHKTSIEYNPSKASTQGSASASFSDRPSQSVELDVEKPRTTSAWNGPKNS